MSLSAEQQNALDALIAQMPRADAPHLPQVAPDRPAAGTNGRTQAAAGDTPAAPAPTLDMLEGWTGISAGKLKLALAALLGKKDELEDRFRAWTEANPLDASFEFLAACAWAFYQAEKGENPKIQTYTDAFYYIATCASVGYADIFAVTQAGKAIAGMVMVVGPAITNKALDRPKR